MVTDSAVFWNDLKQQWAGRASFSAPQNAFGNPYYNWSLSGGTWVETYFKDAFENNHSGSADALLLFGDGAGKALNQTTTVRVFATEANDPAIPVISNSYQIRWHYPYENWAEFAPRTSIWENPENFSVDFPGYAGFPGGIGCSWSSYNPYWTAVQDAAEVGIKIGKEWTAVKDKDRFTRILKSLFVTAEIALQQIGPKPDEGVCTWMWDEKSPSTGEELATYFPEKNDSLQEFYRMEPEVEVNFEVSFWQGDAYDQHGYVGPERIALKRPTSGFRYRGHFHLQERPRLPVPGPGGYPDGGE